MQCWVLHPNIAMIDVILKYISVKYYLQRLIQARTCDYSSSVHHVYLYYCYVHGQYIIKICV